MSLYYEAATILANDKGKGGSLRSRVFSAKDLKNPTTKIYALLVESLKWSPFLKEVIDKSEVLKFERKLSPALAVLLTHDLLLSKGGVAAPKNHVLRLAIEKHKARLSAELTRSRIREGFGSLDAWRTHVNAHTLAVGVGNGNQETHRHPRWVRVNALKTTLEEQLKSTFKSYTKVDYLENVLQAAPPDIIYYIDKHIPELLALPPGHDMSKSLAYINGELILQDKASCFPAYLCDVERYDGDIIDTCAAPGNKTTHLAALLHATRETCDDDERVYAFERNTGRSKVLEKMVQKAGGEHYIKVHGTTDFLTIKPDDPRFAEVQILLLDPSCSGTGIVGRDDEPIMHLPEAWSSSTNPNDARNNSNKNKKRKRGYGDSTSTTQAIPDSMENEPENEVINNDDALEKRLKELSAFQLRLLTHAMTFPSALRISYSTCSIHAEENEDVVMRALSSPVAQKRGWRILKRDEQPEGLKKWTLRGSASACDDADVRDACIRCEKGSREGTMGFFVACFVREGGQGYRIGPTTTLEVEETPAALDQAGAAYEEEWTGFSDDEK